MNLSNQKPIVSVAATKPKAGPIAVDTYIAPDSPTGLSKDYVNSYSCIISSIESLIATFKEWNQKAATLAEGDESRRKSIASIMLKTMTGEQLTTEEKSCENLKAIQAVASDLGPFASIFKRLLIKGLASTLTYSDYVEKNVASLRTGSLGKDDFITDKNRSDVAQLDLIAKALHNTITLGAPSEIAATLTVGYIAKGMEIMQHHAKYDFDRITPPKGFDAWLNTVPDGRG